MSLNGIRNDIHQVERCLESVNEIEGDLTQIKSKVRQDETECQYEWEGLSFDAYRNHIEEIEALMNRITRQLQEHERKLYQLKNELQSDYQNEQERVDREQRSIGESSTTTHTNTYTYTSGNFQF